MTGLRAQFRPTAGGMRYFRGAGVPITPGDPPAVTPRARLHGLMGRSRTHSETILAHLQAGAGGSTTLEVSWRALQPAPGALDAAAAAALVDDLDWADSNALPVLLRCNLGYGAPDWVKDRAGRLAPWYSSENGDKAKPCPSNSAWAELPGGIPIWWSRTYQGDVTDFLGRLATYPRIGAAPAVAAITAPIGGTQYPEVCLRQAGVIENRRALASAGYTVAGDMSAIKAGVRIVHDIFGPLGIQTALALNNHQGVATGSPPTYPASFSADRALELLAHHVSVCGSLALTENNSLANASALYPELMAALAAGAMAGQPLHLQTQTVAKMLEDWTVEQPVTPALTVARAIAMGAASCEIPSGGHRQQMKDAATIAWPAWLIEESAAMNDALTANLDLAD